MNNLARDAFDRGNQLSFQGKYSAAIESYDLAIEIEPAYLKAFLNGFPYF